MLEILNATAAELLAEPILNETLLFHVAPGEGGHTLCLLHWPLCLDWEATKIESFEIDFNRCETEQHQQLSRVPAFPLFPLQAGMWWPAQSPTPPRS